MKTAVVVALGLALLVGLVVLPASLHGPLALAALGGAWLLDRNVARGLGRPRRWLIATAILVGLGAWLGPHDARLWGVRASATGALAGVTMAARAIGILLVTSVITRSIAPAELLERLGRTRARPLAASVVVALRLAPDLASMVRRHADEAKIDAPGLARAPARWFEVLVRAVAHASALADEVASEGERVDAPRKT
jgi:hypothetical protein